MIGGKFNPTTDGDWLNQLKMAVKRDPKRSWLLTVLLAVMATLWGKVMIGSRGPHDAAAAARSSVSAEENTLEPVAPGRRTSAAQSLAEWARQPVGDLNRNLFKAPLDEYPLDPSSIPAKPPTNTQAKLAAAQADEQHKVLDSEMSGLLLEGTVLGSHPGAWISGEFVGVGQVISNTHLKVVGVDNRSAYLSYGKARGQMSMK